MSDQATTPAASDAAPAAAAPAAAPAADAGGTALTAPPAAAPAADGTPPAADPNATGNEPDKKPDEGKPAPRAPAEYADFTLPDGATLAPEVKAMLTDAAKNLDLTQEQAQKLVELDLKRNQQFTERVNAQGTQWLNELPSDKEFGGEKLSENLAIATKAIDAFGTPELKKLLNETRLGNHPELIRVFYRAGKAISQDSRFVAGGSGNQPAKGDAAAALYPNQKPV